MVSGIIVDKYHISLRKKKKSLKLAAFWNIFSEFAKNVDGNGSYYLKINFFNPKRNKIVKKENYATKSLKSMFGLRVCFDL